ncbi:MAG: histidine kinase [Deltaproteobacteria bacterium]|nr:histidine kinase [Deltaproteobacteria bacterium]
MAQSTDGFLWLATDDGLVRFDGMNFEYHTRLKNPRQIPFDRIISLAAADGDGVWVGSASGELFRMDASGTTAYRLPSKSDVAFIKPSAMQVWAAAGSDLFVLHDHDEAFRPGVRFPDAIRAVAALPPNGLAVLVGERAMTVSTAGVVRPLFEGNVMALSGDGMGRVVALDRTGALWQHQQGITKRLGTFAFEVDAYTSLVPGPGPAISVSTRQGTFLWDQSTQAMELVHKVDSSRVRFKLLIDREGSLWIGGAVTLWQASRPMVRTIAADVSDPTVFSIAQTQDGSLWLSTLDGLTSLDNGETRLWRSYKDVPFGCVRSLVPRRAGGLWIASCTEGLILYDRGAFTVMGDGNAGQRTRLRVVFESRDGTVWLGPQTGGLMAFREGVFRWVMPPTSSCEIGAAVHCPSAVANVAETSDGSVWVATEGAGLFQAKNGRVEPFGQGHGLRSTRLLSLLVDDVGDLWVGTRDAGVLRLKHGRFEALGEAQGLPTADVSGLVQDGLGHMWFGSTSGVYSVALTQIEDVFAGRRPTVLATRYGVEDGMPSSRTSDRQSSTAVRAQDGTLWFATHGGAAAFSPLEQQKWPPLPAPVVEVSVDGAPFLRVTDKQWFDLQSSSLQVRYVVPYLWAPHRVRTSIRLGGQDASWRTAGHHNAIDYEGVSAGRRVMTLTASLFPVPVAEQRLSVTLHRAGWWSSPLAWLAAAAACLLLAYAGHRTWLLRQRRHFAAIFAERNRIARDLHDGLAQGFAAISYQLDRVDSRLDQDVDAARAMLEQTHDLVKRCRVMARHTILDLRLSEQPEASSLSEGLQRLCSQAGLASSAHVNLTQEGAPPVLASKERREILFIVKEALTNALVHGRAQNVSITLKSEADGTAIVMEDDGQGFDPREATLKAGGHFGLKGMRERAAIIGAKFDLSSEPGHGTKLHLRLSAS